MAVDPKRTKVPLSPSQRPQVASAHDFGLVKSVANLEHQLTEALSGSIIRQLLLNACDALPNGDRQGVIRIALSRHALYVANRGRFFSAPGLSEGAWVLGERPRESGDGFARRGLGMRAVLALCRRPEIYSGPRVDDRERSFDLQIRFDALQTQRELTSVAPSIWEQLPAVWREELTGPDGFPVLWIPHAIDVATVEKRRELQRAIAFDGQGGPLDTVIRLENGGLDHQPWLAKMRRMIREETQDDALWVLLYRARDILIEDWEAGTVETVRIERSAERVRVRRSTTGQPQTETDWRWIEAQLPTGGDISSRVAWLFRVQDESEDAPLLPIPTAGLAAPLPLTLATGLPFYAWAAWQTDWTGQHLDWVQEADHRRLTDALLALFRQFFSKTAPAGIWDKLVQKWEAQGPEDPVARRLNDGVLEAFRQTAWVRAEGLGQRLKPSEIVLTGEWGATLKQAIPGPLLWEAMGLGYPAGGEGLCAQLGATVADEALLSRWLRSPQLTKAGFTAWNVLFDGIRRQFARPGELQAVVERMRRDASIRPLPVVGEGVEWVNLPDERTSVEVAPLVRYWPTAKPLPGRVPLPIRLLHPQCVWRPDPQGGVWLDEEHLAFLRHFFAVQPLTAEELLGWIPEGEHDEAACRTLAGWLFALLGGGTGGHLSIRRLIGRSVDVAGGDPLDRTEAAASWRERQRQMGRLALPGRDGRLYPAQDLLMGHDWDDGSGDQRALESLYAPIDRPFVASAEVLGKWLPLESVYDLLTAGDAEMAGVSLGLLDPASHLPPLAALNDAERERLHAALIRAFLVRVGVWAVPPIQSVPETDPPWPHLNGKTVQDFVLVDFDRLVKEPEGASVLLRLLNRHWESYGNRFLLATGVCRGCAQHKGNVWLTRPSRFHRQLRGSRWLPHDAGDLSQVGSQGEAAAWWRGDGSGAGSPWRYLDRIHLSLHPLLEKALDISVVGELDFSETVSWLGRFQQRWRNGLEEVVQRDSHAQAAWVGLHELFYRHLVGLVPPEGLGNLPVLARRGDRLLFALPQEARFSLRAVRAPATSLALIPPDIRGLADVWGIKELSVSEKWLWPHGEPLDVTREVKGRLRQVIPGEVPWRQTRFLYGEAFLKATRIEEEEGDIQPLTGVQALSGDSALVALDIPPDEWGERLVPEVLACMEVLWEIPLLAGPPQQSWRLRGAGRDWLLAHERALGGALRLLRPEHTVAHIREGLSVLAKGLHELDVTSQVAAWWQAEGQPALASATQESAGTLAHRYAKALEISDGLFAEAAQSVWGDDWAQRKQEAVARRLYDVAPFIAALLPQEDPERVWENVLALGTQRQTLDNWRESLVREVQANHGQVAANDVFQLVRNLSLEGGTNDKMQEATRRLGLVREAFEQVVRQWGETSGREAGAWWLAIEEAAVPESVTDLYREGQAWRLPAGGGVRQMADPYSRDLAVALFIRHSLGLGQAALVETGDRLSEWLLGEFRLQPAAQVRLAAHQVALRASETNRERIWHLGSLLTAAGEAQAHGVDLVWWDLGRMAPLAGVARPVKTHQDEVGLLAQQWQMAQRLGDQFAVIKVQVAAAIPEARFQILSNPGRRA